MTDTFIPVQLDLRDLTDTITAKDVIFTAEEAYKIGLDVTTVVLSRAQGVAWVRAIHGDKIGSIDALVHPFGKIKVTLRTYPEEATR